jgi:hypothetical protein
VFWLVLWIDLGDRSIMVRVANEKSSVFGEAPIKENVEIEFPPLVSSFLTKILYRLSRTLLLYYLLFGSGQTGKEKKDVIRHEGEGGLEEDEVLILKTQ